MQANARNFKVAAAHFVRVSAIACQVCSVAPGWK
jgi:hypothetical protein